MKRKAAQIKRMARRGCAAAAETKLSWQAWHSSMALATEKSMALSAANGENKESEKPAKQRRKSLGYGGSACIVIMAMALAISVIMA